MPTSIVSSSLAPTAQWNLDRLRLRVLLEAAPPISSQRELIQVMHYAMDINESLQMFIRRTVL